MENKEVIKALEEAIKNFDEGKREEGVKVVRKLYAQLIEEREEDFTEMSPAEPIRPTKFLSEAEIKELEQDAAFIEGLRHVIKNNVVSLSFLQRKLCVGYNHAGKMIEAMEALGYVSAFEGAKTRKVYITKEEFESKYGAL